MTTTLTKTETKHLINAAEAGGGLSLPDSLKPASRERILGRFLRDGLAAADGEAHRLTPAGYRAIGLRPPRVRKMGAATSSDAASAVSRTSKKTLVVDLLSRPKGASLAELTAATGWLPHTTRAALSRIRSAGTSLAKSRREDEVTAYRILPEEPAPARRSRRVRGEAVEAAAA